MLVRGVVSAVAIVLSAGVLSGCVPEAVEPTPTPLFATEEEAFAAAEEVYRAYVDATNAIDLSDPDTFESVFVLTTAEQNANDRRDLSKYHAKGFEVSGASLVESITSSVSSTTEPVAKVCLDVSRVDVRTSSGESIVSPERGRVQSLTVTFEANDSSPHHMLISSIAGSEGEHECD